jgi:GT2 family glycosyltransferase
VGQDDGETGRPSAVTRPEISIAIVSYNTREYLQRCLATLAQAGTARAYEVIVVDNDSTDGSPEVLRAEHPEVRLIANRENVGYSRAVNQAIRCAAGAYVLILNPDIEVIPGSVDALAQHMDENPETGIAGGKLLNPDGTLQYSCRTFYTLSTLLHRRTPIGKLFPNSRIVRDHLMLDWDHESVREVDWMLGACLMVRREAIRDVGLMDERFFMYFEDVDWCYRMKQHGWRVMYVPEAPMRHVHRRESARGGVNRRLLAHLSSMFRFFDKWNELLYRIRKDRDRWLGGLLLVGDAIAVNLAFLAAFGLRTLLQSVLHRPVFPLTAYEPFVILANGVVLSVAAMLGLYRRPSARDTLDDAFDLAKGLAFATLVLMASTFLTRSELHSRFMVFTFVPLAFVGMLAGRAALGGIARAMRRERYAVTRVVVIGDLDAGRELARRIEERPDLGLEVVATLADRPGDEERRFRDFRDDGGIGEAIHRHRVGEVLLVRPTVPEGELARLVLLCRRDGVRVRLVSGVADLLPGQLPVGNILGLPAVDVGAVAGRSLGRARRRAIDWVVATLGLAVMGPFAWRRAARVPREDEEHELVHGLEGRPFRRRPAAARRLADTFGHVVRGELAFVGPRPRSPEEVAASPELSVLFELVRPGVTGSWRLHAQEGLTPAQEVSLAFSWLQNQNPWEDLKIVLRTPRPAGSHPRSSRSDH